jgi:hypothetical protein
MCNFTEFVFGKLRDKVQINPTIKKTKKYIIGSVNIDQNNSIPDIFHQLNKYLLDILTNLKNSEIQVCKIATGYNIDRGYKQSVIHKGTIYEIYCFNCYSLAFLRILLEEGLFIKKKWLSIDIDELLATPWFDED